MSLQKLQAEKQRQFEEAMMEGVSEARMSAMWESAQKSAVSLSVCV